MLWGDEALADLAARVADAPVNESARLLGQLIVDLRHAAPRPVADGRVVSVVSSSARVRSLVTSAVADVAGAVVEAADVQAAAAIAPRPALTWILLDPDDVRARRYACVATEPVIVVLERDVAAVVAELLTAGVEEVFGSSPTAEAIRAASLPFLGVDPRLALQAFLDPLTGLPDRDEAIAAAEELSRAGTEHPWCAVTVEAESAVGVPRAEARLAVSQLLHERFGPPSTIAHLSADRFVVVVSGTPSVLAPAFDDALVAMRALDAVGRAHAAGVQAVVEAPEATIARAERALGEATTSRATTVAIAAPDEEAPPARRVLVASARSAVASALAEVGRAAGLEVEVAYDAVDAIARAQQRTFEALLLDAACTKLTGLELLAALRTMRALRGVPAVVASDPYDDRHVTAAFDAGANDVVRLPLDHEVALARLRRLLDWAARRHG